MIWNRALTQAFIFCYLLLTKSITFAVVRQVEKTQEAVQKEQSLASKLKEEIKQANSSAEEKVQLEQQKVQATEKERALVEKSLEAERQKVCILLLCAAVSPALAYRQVLCPVVKCPALPSSALPCHSLPCPGLSLSALSSCFA